MISLLWKHPATGKVVSTLVHCFQRMRSRKWSSTSSTCTTLSKRETVKLKGLMDSIKANIRWGSCNMSSLRTSSKRSMTRRSSFWRTDYCREGSGTLHSGSLIRCHLRNRTLGSHNQWGVWPDNLPGARWWAEILHSKRPKLGWCSQDPRANW